MRATAVDAAGNSGTSGLVLFTVVNTPPVTNGRLAFESTRAGHYDIVFVESSDHAYSQIKRVMPDLVILCVRIEDLDGFQVLSMLKLDEETRAIPVLTYTTEYEGQDAAEEEAAEPSETEMFAAKPAMRMN